MIVHPAKRFKARISIDVETDRSKPSAATSNDKAYQRKLNYHGSIHSARSSRRWNANPPRRQLDEKEQSNRMNRSFIIIGWFGSCRPVTIYWEAIAPPSLVLTSRNKVMTGTEYWRERESRPCVLWRLSIRSKTRDATISARNVTWWWTTRWRLREGGQRCLGWDGLLTMGSLIGNFDCDSFWRGKVNCKSSLLTYGDIL